ncbi:MAG: trypsin-like serine peptidase [Pseudobdellovibrionaceae bacterium]
MKYFNVIFLICFLAISGCGFESATKSQVTSVKDTVGVIYGEDSVRNVQDSSNPNSLISVAFIPKDTFSRFLQKQPVESVGEKVGITDGIKWINDPSLAVCSGILIDKDLVLTAGHCFDGVGSCSDLNVVFGFEVSPNVLKTMKWIGCKEVIKDKDELIDSGLDYAVVRLETSVSLAKPSVIQKELNVGDEVYTIGYPLGSPKKTAGGKIRKVVDVPNVYNSNLDVYAGNSGSPVFSAKTNELIGIVSTGESDFEDSTDSTGSKIKHCSDDGCLGEIIIPIQKILADMNK